VSVRVATNADRVALPVESRRGPDAPGRPGSEEASRLLAAWLEAEPRPRLLATLDGEVIWMNRAARELPRHAFPFAGESVAGAGDAVRMDPRLLAQDGLAPGQLRCATAGPEFRAEFCMVWSRRLSGPGRPVLALTLRPRRERPNLGLLAEARRLTRGEIRVIELMAAGLETATVAEALGISVETLRTHVKHAYRKLGVTSRGELFAAVADFLQP
jgi:DNA-binding CsgD family transcriptional regulator